MATPIAVIIRFSGDPDDLLERFERARQSWINAQHGDHERPTFYASCKTDNGIAIVTAWETALAHRAFGQGMHEHIQAAGMHPPEGIERLRVLRVGWD